MKHSAVKVPKRNCEGVFLKMRLLFLIPKTKYQIIFLIISILMICVGLFIPHRIGLTIQDGGVLLFFWSVLSFLVYKILKEKIAFSLITQIIGIFIMAVIALLLASF